MRFTIDPSPQETARACAAMVAATLPPTYANAIVFAVYLALGVGAFVLVPSAPSAAILLSVGGLMLALMALQAEARRRARRASKGDPHTLEQHQLEIAPDGIRAWCAHVDTRYTWSGITRVKETKEFYIFVRGSSGGPVLPKRVIASDEDDAALRRLIRDLSPDHGEGLAREVAA